MVFLVVPPPMLKTAADSGGLPIEVFDGIRPGLIADRSQFYKDLASEPFFGANRASTKVSLNPIQVLRYECFRLVVCIRSHCHYNHARRKKT
jgi:hypothetical protein